MFVRWYRIYTGRSLVKLGDKRRVNVTARMTIMANMQLRKQPWIRLITYLNITFVVNEKLKKYNIYLTKTLSLTKAKEGKQTLVKA